MPFTCEICNGNFSRKDHLKRHITNQHAMPNLVHKCTLCGKSFLDKENLLTHVHAVHKPSSQFKEVESAFKQTFITYR